MIEGSKGGEGEGKSNKQKQINESTLLFVVLVLNILQLLAVVALFSYCKKHVYKCYLICK